MIRQCILLAVLALSACAGQEAPTSAAQERAPEPTFKPLFTPQEGLEDWHLENADEASFHYEDGMLEVSAEQGWLRSPRVYADFVLRLQFRFMEADADSGIFLRAGQGTPFIRGWPGDSYQVQTRDISVNTSDNPLPLAQVYRHTVPAGETQYQRDRVFSLYDGVGEWQDYEITVVGDLLSVRLNGELVTTAHNIRNPTGFIGFQSETGVVQFRDMRIYEL